MKLSSNSSSYWSGRSILIYTMSLQIILHFRNNQNKLKHFSKNIRGDIRREKWCSMEGLVEGDHGEDMNFVGRTSKMICSAWVFRDGGDWQQINNNGASCWAMETQIPWGLLCLLFSYSVNKNKILISKNNQNNIF